MGQGDSVSVLTRAKVWKMRECWMYFPFFILHDWGKRSAEARCSHLSGVALISYFEHAEMSIAKCSVDLIPYKDVFFELRNRTISSEIIACITNSFVVELFHRMIATWFVP